MQGARGDRWGNGGQVGGWGDRWGNGGTGGGPGGQVVKEVEARGNMASPRGIRHPLQKLGTWYPECTSLGETDGGPGGEQVGGQWGQVG